MNMRIEPSVVRGSSIVRCGIHRCNAELSFAIARSGTPAGRVSIFFQSSHRVPNLDFWEDRRRKTSFKSLMLLAGVAGLEPATPGFGDRCSSH
jgi:hypothetical protein